MYSRISTGKSLYRGMTCLDTAVELPTCCSFLSNNILFQQFKPRCVDWQQQQQQQQQHWQQQWQQQRQLQWHQQIATSLTHLATQSQQQPSLCRQTAQQPSQQQQQQHLSLRPQLRSFHQSSAAGYSTYGGAGATKATTILCVRSGPEVVIIGDGQATQKDFIVKSNVRKVRRIGPNAVGGFAGVAVDGLSLLERLEAKLEEHPGQLQRAAVELAKMWRQDKILRELDASLVVADAETTLWLMGNGDVLEVAADGVMSIGSGADFAESAARVLLQLQRERRQQQQQQPPAEESGDRGLAVACKDEAQPDGSAGCKEQEPGPGSSTGPDVVATGVSAEAGDSRGRPVEDMTLMEIAQLAMKIAADCCVYTNYNFTWHHIQRDGSIVSGDTLQHWQQQQQKAGER